MITRAQHLAALVAALWLCGGASASIADHALASTAGAAAAQDESVVSAAAPVPLLQPTLCGPALSAGVQRWLSPAPRLFDAALHDRLAVPSTDRVAGDAAIGVPDADPSAVVTLPAGPGSASLVACGLVVLGAVGGLRSLRKAHFGSLPEWYSTSGPQQIGHATPIDFDFPVFEIRPFETVEPLVTLRFAAPLDIRISPQRERLTLVSPRGPPSQVWL